MPEYRSVRETAEKWGVSERRVHKLCKDGRINGLIRFGRSWGIPYDANKPGDARKAGGQPFPANDTEDGTAVAFLGPDAKLLVRGDVCAVYQLENETGNGIVTVYDVFPGIRLFYSDLHLSRITGHDELASEMNLDALVINHCREGRFECEFRRGDCGHLGDGDFAVTQMPMPIQDSSYPLTHYHGITIVMDVPQAAENIEGALAFLGAAHIDIREIKARILAERPFFIMRSSEAVAHIFSELYNAPDALRESYIRLKLIELLLFLSVAEPGENNKRRYFYKTRVNAVKALRDYMTAHLDKQFTLRELSGRFGIPLTAMKSCFKSEFGAPIHAYMREYRLQTASALLRETDEPVAEIAAKVGYGSHARFSTAFKTALGATPSDYRKVSVRNQK
jgi:AraC-like DNA-binding protein